MVKLMLIVILWLYRYSSGGELGEVRLKFQSENGLVKQLELLETSRTLRRHSSLPVVPSNWFILSDPSPHSNHRAVILESHWSS